MSAWAPYQADSFNSPQAFTEPSQTNKIQPPSTMPMMFQGSDSLPMQPHQQAAPPKQYPSDTKNVQIPQQQATKTKWEDISDMYELSDWMYIISAVLIVDIIVLFLIRYHPDIFGKTINVWYNRFKLNAVIADVFIILLGFGIARYVYTEYIYPKFDWNPAYFTGLSVLVQIVHDTLFYFGIVKPLPAGHNTMIDVFKEYGATAGVKAIASDSMMMIGSSVGAMLLKAAPPSLSAFIGLLAVYVVPFVLETRNDYSNII